jgi:hypothetical protein
MSPAESTITSPGTSCFIGTSERRAPFGCRTTSKYLRACSAASSAGSRRITVAVLLTISLSLSAALLDLASCQKRISVDSTTIEAMTTVAFMSSVT